MKATLDCKEVSRLISDGQDQDLPPEQRARMRLHFVICQTCRDVDEQMGFLRRAMRQMGREEVGSPAPSQAALSQSTAPALVTPPPSALPTPDEH